jgi:hypothetical protein
MEKDRTLRLANQERLRYLKRDHGGEVQLMCSHDPVEFESVAGRRSGLPAADPQAASGMA